MGGVLTASDAQSFEWPTHASHYDIQGMIGKVCLWNGTVNVGRFC